MYIKPNIARAVQIKEDEMGLGAGGGGMLEILAENLLQRTIYGTKIRLAVYYITNYFSPVIPVGRVAQSV